MIRVPPVPVPGDSQAVPVWSAPDQYANVPGTLVYGVCVKNNGSNPCDLGPSTVAVGDFTLAAGGSISIDLPAGDSIYAIAAAATQLQLAITNPVGL